MKQILTDNQMSEPTFNFAVYSALFSRKHEIMMQEESRKNKLAMLYAGLVGTLATSVLLSQKVETTKIIEVVSILSLVLYFGIRKLIPNKYDKQLQINNLDRETVNVTLGSETNFSREHVESLKRIMVRNAITDRCIATYYEFKSNE